MAESWDSRLDTRERLGRDEEPKSSSLKQMLSLIYPILQRNPLQPVAMQAKAMLRIY